MKKQALLGVVCFHPVGFVLLLLLTVRGPSCQAAQATLLFEDNFTGGIPGWTAVQPSGGNYLDGPMLWEYDATSGSFSEQSNLYTDSATFSVTRIAAMLINDAVAPSNFTYTARLTAGDDDAFGLIWGFQGEDTFYRVYFARQNRLTAGWPFQGWGVDRLNRGQITDLFGAGTSNFVPSFINVAGRPFDVTIAVTNNLLTLSLVDDPDGAPALYNLVNGEALAGNTDGRVGMFSWGQSGPGGGIRSFRVQNPTLSPTPLAGNPAASVLTNWTFLVTPRADGTVPTAPGPLWAQGLSINGDRGTMIENSDWTVDNNAAAYTNFPAPAAVAGDVNWSNYVYSARFISSDDDGFGMLLRFKNEMNFYRIAFRNQSTASGGVRRGISIQKNVDLAFDEIFASTQFIPPIAVPFDVHASIRGNRLQVIIISNPTSTAAQRFFFGPFDITGGTVDNGKIGVFSWAQFSGGTVNDAGTEVDFVRVAQVSGEGLLVASLYGTPDPPVGLNDLAPGAQVTATVTNLVDAQPGVRRALVGWDGFGSVPTNGTSNQVTFTLNSFSLLTWQWRTEYLLTASASAGGQVSATLGPWIAESTNVTVTATPSPGNLFVGWAGDSLSTLSNLSFAMTRPVNLTAMFAADSDGDGLADSWELSHFGNLNQTAAGDADNDGVSNLDEFKRGSDPNFAETLTVSDGLSSQWINTQRDPVLPGQLGVVDFGGGYRGAYDNSNDNRFGDDATFVAASNLTAFASFQSPIVVIRSNLWNPAWAASFSASMEFTVGDNDANCFYFRYLDEQNWYRATICGEMEGTATNRPRFGVSLQMRLNGKYSEVGTFDAGIATDPLDTTGYKRVKVTVNATNENFEVRVVGWNAFLPVPDFDPGSEHVLTFSDTNHLTGRIGFGLWGQGGFGSPNATNGIPVSSGAFVDNIIVTSGGSNVFTETWETAALTNGFAPGWSNPFAGTGPGTIEGDWEVSAHGTLMQLSNFGLNTTGSALVPKADVDGPILLAPAPGENYLLEIGFHPFDDDGIGLVYNFYDTNNYSRVLFVSEATVDGRIPQGLSVSHKRNGQWTDIVAGDGSFVYRPGQPFAVDFANNNGACRLRARELDNPATVYEWQWAEEAATGTNRFGLTTWAQTDAHFLYARAFRLPSAVVPAEFRIGSVAVSRNTIVLDVLNSSASPYGVQVNTNLATTNWTTVASGQTNSQWSGAIPAGTRESYWRLLRNSP